MIIELKITTDGSGAGSATSDRITGFLIGGIQFNFAGTTDAGADTLLVENQFGKTITSISNSATDVIRNPQEEIQESDVGGTATGSFMPFFLNNATLTLSIAQGGASVTDAVIARISILEI